MRQYIEKLPLKEELGRVRLIEVSSIFYIELEGGDTIIKTKRKKLYKSKETLGEIEKRLC